MRVIHLPSWLGAVLALFLVSLAYAVPEKTVYSFGAPGSGDGMYPYSQVLFDASGDIYGLSLIHI